MSLLFILSEKTVIVYQKHPIECNSKSGQNNLATDTHGLTRINIDARYRIQDIKRSLYYSIS